MRDLSLLTISLQRVIILQPYIWICIMQTLKLEIEDSKIDIVLTIIKNLKKDIVKSYEVIGQSNEAKEFGKLSEKSLNNVWDNAEDSEYDRFLKV